MEKRCFVTREQRANGERGREYTSNLWWARGWECASICAPSICLWHMVLRTLIRLGGVHLPGFPPWAALALDEPLQAWGLVRRLVSSSLQASARLPKLPSEPKWSRCKVVAAPSASSFHWPLVRSLHRRLEMKIDAAPEETITLQIIQRLMKIVTCWLIISNVGSESCAWSYLGMICTIESREKSLDELFIFNGN